MHKAKIHTFENNQGNVFEYYTYGNKTGYPVLYMHGAIPMPFSPELSGLIESHNLYVIMLLRPGYGASSRLNHKNIYEYVIMLQELINALGLEYFDVLGWSAGAPYCYGIDHAYENLVNGVNICSGIPLANIPEIYHMNKLSERLLFSLSKHLPAYIIGKYGIGAIAATERKKGWKDVWEGETMDHIFQNYVYPNWYGLGQSTNIQYRYWGFSAETISNEVYIYHSKDDEMIPFRIALQSSKLLKKGKLYTYDGEEHSSELLLKDAFMNIAKRHL